jgi:hypothetical protein
LPPAPGCDHGQVIDDAEKVAKKLKLGAAKRPILLNDPGGYREGLAGASAGLGTTADGKHDWILLFAATKAQLEASIQGAAAALDSPGTLWIAYPKGTSKAQTDLTRDQGWDALKGVDLMWLSLISIDDTWSAFGLRQYKPGEARQTFR